MTKKAAKEELATIIAAADHDCRHTGKRIEQLLYTLRFKGVGCYVPRGIGDTGLSRKVLQQLLSFALPYELFGHIVDYLDDGAKA